MILKNKQWLLAWKTIRHSHGSLTFPTFSITHSEESSTLHKHRHVVATTGRMQLFYLGIIIAHWAISCCDGAYMYDDGGTRQINLMVSYTVLTCNVHQPCTFRMPFGFPTHTILHIRTIFKLTYLPAFHTKLGAIIFVTILLANFENEWFESKVEEAFTSSRINKVMKLNRRKMTRCINTIF